jgi:enoyl-CoA hydratase/carnithine racemase
VSSAAHEDAVPWPDGPRLRHVRLERVGEHVVELVLDRPEALNAVSTALAIDLTAATAALASARGVRAVVVSSSSERAFCVGADLKERNGFSDAELMAQRPLTSAAYRGVLDLPMPVVAAVHGFALGGGFEIALSCDLVVADETAVVGLPEVSVGVVPGGGGTQLLTRRVGWSRAADLVFTARRLTAEQALAHGVVDRVVPAGAARTAARELATAIAANSPVGLRQAKRAMRLGLDVDLATGLAVEDAAWRATAFSPDRTEGVQAFADKRTPRWRSDA